MEIFQFIVDFLNIAVWVIISVYCIITTAEDKNYMPVIVPIIAVIITIIVGVNVGIRLEYNNLTSNVTKIDKNNNIYTLTGEYLHVDTINTQTIVNDDTTNINTNTTYKIEIKPIN